MFDFTEDQGGKRFTEDEEGRDLLRTRREELCVFDFTEDQGGKTFTED